MDTKTHGAHRRLGTFLAVATLLAGCSDATAPLAGEQPNAAEAALDGAAASLASLEQGMAADAQRESDRQRERSPDGTRDRRHVDRAGLAVELGAAAVGLATRILEEEGADRPQLRLLKAAARLQREAEAALAAGDAAHAVRLAGQACWTALKAVVLPGGVSEEEARFVHDLAAELLGAARAEVAAAGTPVEAVVLRWAERFFEIGAAQLAAGDIRGVAALWKSAVASSWILG